MKTCCRCGHQYEARFRQCPTCKRASNRKWNALNPDKVRDSQLRRRLASLEEIRERERAGKARQRLLDPEGWRAKKHEAKVRYRTTHPEYEREYARRYRAAHLDQVRERQRMYYAANLEKRRASARASARRRYSTNRDRVQRSNQKWKSANPQRLIEYNRRRRAKKQNCKREHYDPYPLLDSQGWLCFYCGDPLVFAGAHLEHRVPLCRGGSDTLDNVAWSCPSCNLKKGRMTEAEFRETQTKNVA